MWNGRCFKEQCTMLRTKSKCSFNQKFITYISFRQHGRMGLFAQKRTRCLIRIVPTQDPSLQNSSQQYCWNCFIVQFSVRPWCCVHEIVPQVMQWHICASFQSGSVIQLYFWSEDKHNILSLEGIAKIHEVEQYIYNKDGFESFCLRQEDGTCQKVTCSVSDTHSIL